MINTKFEIFLIVIGTVILRFIVHDDLEYLLTCAIYGAILGIVSGTLKDL